MNKRQRKKQIRKWVNETEIERYDNCKCCGNIIVGYYNRYMGYCSLECNNEYNKELNKLFP